MDIVYENIFDLMLAQGCDLLEFKGVKDISYPYRDYSSKQISKIFRTL
jgi:hypothetical protein